MGSCCLFRRSLAIVAVATFFFLPASGDERGFNWTLSFGDLFDQDLDGISRSDLILMRVPPGKGDGPGGPAAGGPAPAGGDPRLLGRSGGCDPSDPCLAFATPAGWRAEVAGEFNEGNLTLAGACASAYIGWFEDSGIDPEGVLRQVVRGYRAGSLRFSVLTAEPGDPVTIDGQSSSTLNVYYRYGGQESKKRLAAWASPISGRFFYASFWSCPDEWDENLASFTAFLESFKDGGSYDFVVLEPRRPALDGWGTLLSLTLQSYHFSGCYDRENPVVEVKVAMKSRREGERVDEVASEEVLSLIRGAQVPADVQALQEFLVDRGYGVAILRRGGDFWPVVQGPEGRWQAVSIARSGQGGGLGSLVDLDEAYWYRGLVVDYPEDRIENRSFEGLKIEKDCDPPFMVDLLPASEVNLTWILGLRDLLDRHSYVPGGSDPEPFHRAQICWALLEREGYDALMVTGYEGHPLDTGMWVAVRHPGGGGHLAVAPSSCGDGGLGEIVSGAEYLRGIAYETSLQFSCLHPDKGLSIDPETVRTPAMG
ncbi:hypothetical protein [Candidatus Methanocrinis natronophilus]|uniref:Peptidase C39-like domain-containing protein n=1 Tax=Candidatus Methanocrinis natronophilus TaxID=3033396 RepID=A0ABT5X7M6_9EURY|nr:hypothetical protein [Candidatus Methanocrinis natronophilus]MDF0590695.1 hypothetical protein [Candidatus Methanocrinis natronophilus]